LMKCIPNKIKPAITRFTRQLLVSLIFFILLIDLIIII